MHHCYVGNSGKYVKLLFQFTVLGDHTETFSPVKVDEDREAFGSFTMMDDMQVYPLLCLRGISQSGSRFA